MSYDPNQAPKSDYGNPPYGVPPSESYGSPQNPYGAPPQGPYGAPAYQQPGFGYSPPPVTPRPLSDTIRELPRQYIKVITKPSAATFAEEINKASWGTLWVQLLGLALFSLVISLLLIPLYPLLIQRILEVIPMPPGANPLPPATLQQFQTSYLNSVVSSVASVPVYFFIGQAIYYFLAKAFRGTGTFLAQGYTALLFYVPLTIIGSVLATLALALGALAPAPAGLLIALSLVLLSGLALDVYRIVLQIFTIMAAHRLSGGRATAVVLIPYAVFLVLYLILVFLIVFIVIFILSALQPH